MSAASWVSSTAQRQGQMVRGTIWKQKGARFIQRATGAVEYHVSYKCNTLDVPIFLPTPQTVSEDFNNFWLDESESDEETLGISIIYLKYLGVRTIPPPRYFLRCNKITQPIDTNVNFLNLVKAAGGFTGGANPTSIVATAVSGPLTGLPIITYTPNGAKAVVDAFGKFQGFGKDCLDPALIGVSIFDDTAVSYISKFVSASRRLDYIKGLQTISTPDGNPPTFPNRNWKLSDVSENSIGMGAFYEYEVTWELSGQGGWYPGIYGGPAQSLGIVGSSLR